METQPDLTFYFAIHEAHRSAVERYRVAVSELPESKRVTRGKALVRWSKGFTLALEEHHYAEDTFFFPSLRIEVAHATPLLDELDADHRALDRLLERWPAVSRSLADPAVPFAVAKADAVTFAEELQSFLLRHLAVEDADVLPLFWRHYTAAAYDAVQAEAIKKSKKAGMWFIAPFTVDCYAEGPKRDAFLASVPWVLRALHRIVRPSYDRVVAEALSPSGRSDHRRRAAARR